MAHQSASGPVLTAVYAALNVAGFTGCVSGKTVRVSNDPTQSTSAPYTVIGVTSENRMDAMGRPGKEVVIALEHYSDYGGDYELSLMRSKAIELLHYVALTITNHAIVQPGGEYDSGQDSGLTEIAGVKRRCWVDFFRIHVVQSA